MKNLNKVKNLQIYLQSEMLKFNVKLQSISAEERELKERNRLEEIETTDLSEEEIEEVLQNISEIEDTIQDLLGIEADKIELQKLLEINSIVADYNKAKLHSDLMNEIATELELENEKEIFAYDYVAREYKRLKFDDEHYNKLCGLNIIVKNGVLLYMKENHLIWNTLLNYIYEKDFTTLIFRKDDSDDIYDIRKENLEFISVKERLEEDKKMLDEGKEILESMKDMDMEEVEKALEYAINEKAQEVIEDLEEMLTEEEKREIFGDDNVE